MRREWWYVATVALVTGGYLVLFCLNKRLPMTDEGFFLVLAREIAEGGRPYGAYHLFYSPLGYLLQALWMKVVGLGVWANRWTTVLLAVGTSSLAYRAAHPFLSPRGAWLAGVAVFLAVFPYHAYANYNHYALFFAVASASFLLAPPGRGGAAVAGGDGGSAAGASGAETGTVGAGAGAFGVGAGAFGLAGACAALAFLSKQNVGALALLGGVAGILLAEREARRNALRFAFGAASVGLVFIVCAGAFGFLRDFVEQAVLGGIAHGAVQVKATGPYPLNQLAKTWALLRRLNLHALDDAAHAWSFVLPYLIGAALLAIGFARRRTEPAFARSALYLAVFSALAPLGALHAPTTWHISYTKPLSVLGGAALLAYAARRRVGRLLVPAVAAAFFALHLGRQAMILDDYDAPVRAEAARGIFMRAWEADLVNTGLDFLARVPADEAVFVAAPDPMYYYLTDRRAPIRWLLLDPPAMTEPQKLEVREALRRADVRWILLLTGRSSWYDYRPVLGDLSAWQEAARGRSGPVTVRLLKRGEPVVRRVSPNE